MTLNDRVKHFFEKNDITYQFHHAESDDEGDTFEAGFRGNNGKFRLTVVTDEEDEYILIMGYPAFSVPKKYIDKAIHVANLLNKDRLFVFSYVDPEEGDVVFRLSIIASPDMPEENLDRAIWTVCGATDNEMINFMENVFRPNGEMN